MKKLYIYVDESVQDTAGRLFIVSAVVVEEERDVVETRLTHIEQSSGKGTVRWIKTSLRHKQRYLGQVFQSNLFVGKLFFSYFTNTTHYVDATLLTISRAIHHKTGASPYTATVFIEGLSKHQVVRFPRELRKVFGVRVHKVRPLPHRSHSTIRLADALAGNENRSPTRCQAAILRKQFRVQPPQSPGVALAGAVHVQPRKGGATDGGEGNQGEGVVAVAEVLFPVLRARVEQRFNPLRYRVNTRFKRSFAIVTGRAAESEVVQPCLALTRTGNNVLYLKASVE